MAVFTSRNDDYRYAEHYSYTDRYMIIYTSVLNPQNTWKIPIPREISSKTSHTSASAIPGKWFNNSASIIPDEPV